MNCLFIIIRLTVKCKCLLVLSYNFLIFQMNPREDLWNICEKSIKFIVEF